MEGAMVGADADVLSATGRRFLRSSELLRGYRGQLTSMIGTAAWSGADADHSRAQWHTVSAPALGQASRFVEMLGNRLLEHAAEQRRASAGVGAGTDAGALGPIGFGPRPPGGLLDGFRDRVDEVLDGWCAAGPSGLPSVSDGPADRLSGLRPGDFAAPDGGRAAVLMAMQGLAEEDRIARDEIEIRALDNGRFVVVLPGVTDLSEGFDQFVDQVRRDGPFGVPAAGREAVEAWVDNDEPTVRKMRYAYEAARRDDTTVNEYSVATIEALREAGVPRGAEVMIVGHSFGAYTAVDLAADRNVNAAHGGDPAGYHVRITHVIAAGAETDWRFDELPAGTATLVLNNRFDGVYRAEDLLHGDGHARHDSHLEHNFWGGWEGYGHDEHNYIEWLADTRDSEIEDWLADAGERYAAAGTRVSVLVPDPNTQDHPDEL